MTDNPVTVATRGSCFVMQPFDGDKFDKRYKDVFEPAIRAAGLAPYRVDHDPSVTIPIESIEKGISDATVCFAEITTDNPNVWYELGFAFASGKPVCMVCSKERTQYPFDVRHRALVVYETGAPSDFVRLGDSITSKLRALLDNQVKFESAAAILPAASMDGLRANEIAILAVLMSEDGAPPYRLRNEMDKACFNSFATNIGIEKLRRLGLVMYKNVQVHDQDYAEEWLMLTKDGVDWLVKNEDKFQLRTEKTSPSS